MPPSPACALSWARRAPGGCPRRFGRHRRLWGRPRARARDARLPNSTWTGARRARRTWPRRGVFRSWRRWRANISAARFETPASMRSLLFSRSSSSRRSSSGVLAAASVVTPASPRHLIRRESVELPRPYSAISSPLGSPARQGCAICRLNSSVNFPGWLGPAIAGPFSGGSSVPLRTV